MFHTNQINHCFSQTMNIACSCDLNVFCSRSLQNQKGNTPFGYHQGDTQICCLPLTSPQPISPYNHSTSPYPKESLVLIGISAIVLSTIQRCCFVHAITMKYEPGFQCNFLLLPSYTYQPKVSRIRKQSDLSLQSHIWFGLHTIPSATGMGQFWLYNSACQLSYDSLPIVHSVLTKIE